MKGIRASAAATLACVLVACGGGGEAAPVPPPGGGGPPQLPDPATAPALKTIIAGNFGTVNFPVGAAIGTASTTGADAALLTKHFSSITAENVMKPDTIKGTSEAQAYNFAPADQLAAFAQANNMRLRGHALLWHQTAPAWFFAGDQSNAVLYRSTVRNRLRTYIVDVVTHFGAQVYAWDVVNEVASDTQNDANPYRTSSPWYQAYSVGGLNGSDYVADAFLFANEARTSLGLTRTSMKLMLNDYNTELPGKRANVIQIVQSLITQGVPIDGVGHQFHLTLGLTGLDIAAALDATQNLGAMLDNHVTELDVSIYDDPGSCFSSRTIPPCLADYGANPPQTVLSQQATLYRVLFNRFRRPDVTSITFWGFADKSTWLNSFPVNRTNRPLLFDTALNPKWAFWTVVDPTIVVP